MTRGALRRLATTRTGVSAGFVIATLSGLAMLGAVLGGLPSRELVDSYLVTNLAFGLGFGTCGVVIAVRRPDHIIGWLLVLGSAAHLATAAAGCWIAYGYAHGWSSWFLRLLVTLALSAWPAGVILCFPAAFLLFPTGRLLSRWWRLAYVPLWLGWVSEVGAFSPEPFDTSVGVTSLLASRAVDAWLSPAAAVLQVGTGLAMVMAIAQLVVRVVRGGAVERRQITWLTVAVLVAVALNLQRLVTGDGPILFLLAFQLIPVTIAIAIVRHQLFDIKLVVARSLLYLLLTGGLVGVYAAVVVMLTPVASRTTGGIGGALVAALLFNPARVWLQRRVDRLFYGERDDPLRALATVTTQLTGGRAQLQSIAADLADALRLPYLEVLRGSLSMASSDVRPVHTATVDVPGGQVVAGLRYGQARLSSADQRALGAVVGPLLLAMERTELAEELATSRRELVGAHERERRRIHRDLHDSLGPTLTGIAFTTDAVRNRIGAASPDMQAMLDELRRDVTTSIGEVRRLVYDLRPPLLDTDGLEGAVRAYATRLARDVVVVDLDVKTAPIPDEVAVTAYRIACEAMTNAVRHAKAGRLSVRIAADTEALTIVVKDDGTATVWGRTGTGVASMTERAALIGGTCTAGPTPHGGRVHARLPLPAGGAHPSRLEAASEPARAQAARRGSLDPVSASRVSPDAASANPAAEARSVRHAERGR